MITDDELSELIETSCSIREAFFDSLGQAGGSWATQGPPRGGDGPHWPTRPGWQRINDGETTMIASSGLSDPWYESEEANNGLRIETIVATKDALPIDSTEMMSTWLYRLALAISTDAAADGRYWERNQRFGLFLIGVTQTGSIDVGADWICEDGGLGFLLGLPIPDVAMTIETPSQPSVLLTAKLLTPQEYAFVAQHGPQGAEQLAELFRADGTHHLSSMSRASVI